MYRKFENLPEDKKKRIIDVCLEEFASNGYDKASTNSIVKKAGISKGILFHYFGSKKHLYLYMLDYVIEYARNQFYSLNSVQPEDIFERMRDWGVKKQKVARENPFMFNILMEAFVDVPEELAEEIQARYVKLYNENMPVFLKGIDKSKFREDISFDKAIEIIFIVHEALGNKLVKMYRNQEDMSLDRLEKNFIEEYMEYMEILKSGIYKL